MTPETDRKRHNKAEIMDFAINRNPPEIPETGSPKDPRNGINLTLLQPQGTRSGSDGRDKWFCPWRIKRCARGHSDYSKCSFRGWKPCSFRTLFGRNMYFSGKNRMVFGYFSAFLRTRRRFLWEMQIRKVDVLKKHFQNLQQYARRMMLYKPRMQMFFLRIQL